MMAEIKDKVVTVESLSSLHEYNKNTYETKENVETLLNDKFDKPKDDIVPINNGGTGSDCGDIGLQNLLSEGWMILSSYQYGDELPPASTVGRIFFKRLTDI